MLISLAIEAGLRFFIMGPLLGLLLVQVFPLFYGRQNDFKSHKYAVRIILGAECAALLLCAPLIGYLALLSSLLTLLTFFAIANYLGDPDFRAEVDRLVAEVRARNASKSSSKGASKPKQPFPQATTGKVRSGDSSSTPSLVTSRSTSSVDASSFPRAHTSDERLLKDLLDQVKTLQSWTLRTDSDRQALSALTNDTNTTDKALRTAVEQVHEGAVDWAAVDAHVSGLKRHDLPEEISLALNKLLAERSEAIHAGKMQVEDLAAKLSSHRHALQDAVSKPQLSPQEVLAAAELALVAASDLKQSDRKQN